LTVANECDVLRHRWSGRAMANRFDAVPVGIEDKRSVVICAVLGVEATAAIVLAAMLHGRPIKLIHSFARGCGERDVKTITGNLDFVFLAELDRKCVLI